MYLGSILLIITYIFIVYRVAGSRPLQFPILEKNLIYHNSGEVNYISPYLINREKNGSIIVIGPSTAIAYQANMQVYNLKHGYGLMEISDIVGSSAIETFQIIQKKNINYVAVSTQQDQEHPPGYRWQSVSQGRTWPGSDMPASHPQGR